jgi:hypothetical protein
MLVIICTDKCSATLECMTTCIRILFELLAAKCKAPKKGHSLAI